MDDDDPGKVSSSPFFRIFELLLSRFGPGGWWPVTPDAGDVPCYSGGPVNEQQRFEVVVGAVLTQNTAWKNAEKAIMNLTANSALAPERIIGMEEEKLAAMIRSSGYFNQKAARLRRLARHILATGRPTRESLLEINGIGPETADSIMLYAYDELHFVVDAYTRRIFSRIGLIEPGDSYEEIKERFETAVPADARVYQEYHALIVELAKRFCQKTPTCASCPVRTVCFRRIT
ncbi:MAG: endonuclease III domain-containing protein [Candidatus Krumholzibacteria bacterium]|nr:endonuclease III domain-containing protein [Candidatus Krumholzibacteria bacterium]